MDVGEYRKAYEDELKTERTVQTRARAKAGRPPTTAALLKVLKDKTAWPATRIATLDRLAGGAFAGKGKIVSELVGLVADLKDDPSVRLAALSVLGELSFASVQFQPFAGAYREALRAAATDRDRKLRERILEVLALQKDEYAQRLIVDGLKDKKKALVSTRKGVQYLGYDVHAEHYDLLHRLVEKSTDKKVRNGALRLLAADSGSKDLFHQIVLDKGEDTEARSISATALQSLAPEEFRAAASAVVVDDDDDDDLRTSFLTALQHDDAHGLDAGLAANVAGVVSRATSKPLARAARSYINAVEVADGPG